MLCFCPLWVNDDPIGVIDDPVDVDDDLIFLNNDPFFGFLYLRRVPVYPLKIYFDLFR